MDPAEGVENILRYILGVNAIDGIAHVLPSGHNQAEGQQYHHGDAVVQAEYGRIDVDMTDLDKVLETAKDIQHGGLNGRRARENVAEGFCCCRCSSSCTSVVVDRFAALLCQYHLQSELHIGVLLIEAARSFAKKSSTGRRVCCSQVQRRHITCSSADLAVLQRRYLIIMLAGENEPETHSGALTVCTSTCVSAERRARDAG